MNNFAGLPYGLGYSDAPVLRTSLDFTPKSFNNYVDALPPSLVPPPQFRGNGDVLDIQNTNPNLELNKKDKGFPAVGTLVALAAAAITTVVLARKGKIFKSGKFGGKFGDWIRSIGKVKDPTALAVKNTENLVKESGKSLSVKPAQNLSFKVDEGLNKKVADSVSIKGGQTNEAIKLADQNIGQYIFTNSNNPISLTGNVDVGNVIEKGPVEVNLPGF